MEILYYDKLGHPVSRNRWLKLIDDREYKKVAWTELPGDVVVSTVWLGLDHDFAETGVPVIFETLIMGGLYDGEMYRYHTLVEAEEGHALLVASLKEEEMCT